MSDDVVALDGNAAAGRLGQFFAFEVTTALVTCGHCAQERPLAELRLYGLDAAIVLRCPDCDGVNIRMLDTDRWMNLDLSGTTRIRIGR